MSKTILITGATDGIGLLTAQKLSHAGHTLLLHGRSEDKLEAAAAKIRGHTELYRADLARLEEAVAMADSIVHRHPSLDVLINNAGVLKAPHTETEDGFDVRFVVNTFAPYVLTQRLLPILPNDGRVINLSSAAQAPVNIEAMKSYIGQSDMDAYAQSKLAITTWSRELAKERPEGPVIISVNPGSLLATNMVREGFGIAGNDVSVGADILVEAATGSSFADATGKYYDNDIGGFNNPHPACLDQDQAKAVMLAIGETTATALGSA